VIKIVNVPGSYDVLVYREGDYAVAVDYKGRKIVEDVVHDNVIQTAVNSGHTVVLKGEFNVAQIIISKPTRLIGLGAKMNVYDRDNMVKYTNPVQRSYPVIGIVGAKDVEVGGISIYYDNIGRTDPRDAVYVHNSSDVYIHDMYIERPEGMGIHITSSSSDSDYNTSDPLRSNLKTYDVVVERVTLVTPYSTTTPSRPFKAFGFEVEYAKNVTIRDSKCYDCDYESAYRTHRAVDVLFENIFSSMRPVIEGDHVDIYRSAYVTVKNISAVGTSDIGIYELCRNITIDGGQISRDTFNVAIWLHTAVQDPSFLTTDVVIRNVNIVNGSIVVENNATYFYNIEIDRVHVSRIRISRGNNIKVVNSIFDNPNYVGITSYVPVEIRGNVFANSYIELYSDAIVEGNEIYGRMYGIHIRGGAGRVIIARNYIHDIKYQAIFTQVDSGYSVNDTLILLDNVIYNTSITCGTPCKGVHITSNTLNKIYAYRNFITVVNTDYSIYAPTATGIIKDNVVDKPIYAPNATVS